MLKIIIADDYGAFNKVWTEPAGGLHGYLVRFLESQDNTFQHIAVWTIVQLLESGDATLEQSIRSSPRILPLVSQLTKVSSTAASSQAGDAGSPPSIRRSEQSDDEEEEADGEIAMLARKIIDLVEDAKST